MSGTTTTTEKFPGDTAEALVEAAVALRIKAGAIESKYKKEGDKWVLYTQWNVIGENES